MNPEALPIGGVIGLLSTGIMDIGGGIALRFGLAGARPPRTGHHLIGRWFGYLLRGKLTHVYIIDTPPLVRETLVGVFVHYAIGSGLGLLYLVLLGTLHALPTLTSAFVFGLATTVLPWFYLYPSWGYGWFGADAKGVRMTYISLYSHAIFGLGLALWTALLYPS